MENLLFVERPDLAVRPYIQIENSLFIDEIPLNPEFSYTFTKILSDPLESTVEQLGDRLSATLLSQEQLETVILIDEETESYYVDIFLSLLEHILLQFLASVDGKPLGTCSFNVSISSFGQKTQVDASSGCPVKTFAEHQIHSMQDMYDLASLVRPRLETGDFYCRVRILTGDRGNQHVLGMTTIFSMICASGSASEARKRSALVHSQLSSVLSSFEQGAVQINHTNFYVKTVSENLNCSDKLLSLTFLTEEITESQEVLLKNASALAHTRSLLSTGKSMSYDARIAAAQRIGDIYTYQLEQVSEQLKAQRQDSARELRKQQICWIRSVLEGQGEKDSHKTLGANPTHGDASLPPASQRVYDDAINRLDTEFQVLGATDIEEEEMERAIMARKDTLKKESEEVEKSVLAAREEAEIEAIDATLRRERAIRAAQDVIDGNVVAAQNLGPERRNAEQRACQRLQGAGRRIGPNSIFDECFCRGERFYIEGIDLLFMERQELEVISDLLNGKGDKMPLSEELQECGANNGRYVCNYCSFALNGHAVVARVQDALPLEPE